MEKYRKETEKLSKDFTVLQDVVGSTWRKENELKEQKTELAALDRKIQLSLKTVSQENVGEELLEIAKQGETQKLEPTDRLKRSLINRMVEITQSPNKSKISH
jgi:hypothetical protein